ncbi:MAG: (5-formylfuran-3-yl)methyl phosphate synthase [Gammaproteobacteria bacterium]
MSLLLASVRDVFEAEVALAAGADWIDVKEPASGALGAAPVAVVADIVKAVGGRRPVSATIGDCWHEPAAIAPRAATLADSGVDYVKAALAARDITPAALAAVARAAEGGRPLIAVCMAEAPPTPTDVARLADSGLAGIMLDTADKHGPSLTGLLDAGTLVEFVAAARMAGLLCGLAGRLRVADIATLASAGADYLGFRSALCKSRDRTGCIDAGAVREVVAAMQAAFAPAQPNTVAR